jgi:ferrous iron transport protein B
LKGYSKKIDKTIKLLTEKVKTIFPNLPNARWVALRLLEGDQEIIDTILSGEIGSVSVSSSNTISENV